MTNIDRAVRLARYALPAAIVICVLWAGYATASQRRYETANGVAGELGSGESVGQSFVARYDGLVGVEVLVATYGRMTDTARSTLVMHLRASPDSREDIASITIPPGETLGENPWYLFKFESISDSRGRQYYVTVETPDGAPGRSMSLFWYQPAPRGDPYAEGRAYRNGQPTTGDLAFGLRYAAPPLQVWGSMVGEAGENTSAWLVWGLLVIAGAGMLLFALGRFGGGRGGFETHPCEGRGRGWSLLWVLGVGLVYGLLFMVITPPWQGPDEYAHYAYAALLDKHGLDAGKVQALALGSRASDVELVNAVNASADKHEFTRRARGSTNPGAPTHTDAFLFQQVRQPPTYYWLCALGLRAARLVGIPADPYANPEVSLYTMRSVSLALSLVVVCIAWLAFGIWIALGVALLPMHVFAGTMINNDIPAEVVVSALFVSVLALLKTAFDEKEGSWPSKRGIGLAAICVLLGIAGIGVKATAPAAGLPLLAGGLTVWLVAGLSRRFRAATPGRVRNVGARLLVGVLVAPLIAGGIFLTLFEQREDASVGWFRSYVPLQSVQRISTDSAHEGRHALQMEATRGERAMQRLIPPLIYHPALRVTLAGWLRLEPGQAQPATGQVAGELAVMDGAREAGFAFTTLNVGSGWSRVEVIGDVEANAEEIGLRIGVRDGNVPGAKMQFDDLSLRVEGVDGPWNDPIYKAALVDPSAEKARWSLRPLFQETLPGEVGDMASAILNPQPFGKLALWGDYARSQYVSFWGSFGWLSIDLPLAAYLGIGGLLILACVGLALRAVERYGRWGWRGGLAVASIASLASAIAIGFAKQTALTAYGGLPSFPQGRYLFVLIIPIVWLFYTGLRVLGERVWPQGATTWRLVSAHLLLLFALYSLLALVVPYYYG